MKMNYEITQERLDYFIQLSELLLDKSNLNRDLAKAYFQIIIDQSPEIYGPGDEYTKYLADSNNGAPLDIMFDVFLQVSEESAETQLRVVSELFASDSTLAPIANNILVLWYNGYLNNQYPPAKYYSEALIWKTIRANPPGITGPFYGHWAYLPEEQIFKPEFIKQSKQSKTII